MEVKQEELWKRKGGIMVKQTILKFKFDETDWTRMKELKDVQAKYNFFLMIYERAVKK